jgi:PHD/YefM family antitoxin component YafN of YafNO toxin-antitoxin module
MLDEMHKTISMSELLRNPERVATDVEQTGAIYRVTRRGHRSLVLMDKQFLDGWIAAIEFMQRPNWREEWEEAQRDIAEGRLYDLDDVLKELGLEDAPHRSRKPSARRAATTRRAKGRKRATRAARHAE